MKLEDKLQEINKADHRRMAEKKVEEESLEDLREKVDRQQTARNLRQAQFETQIRIIEGLPVVVLEFQDPNSSDFSSDLNRDLDGIHRPER